MIVTCGSCGATISPLGTHACPVTGGTLRFADGPIGPPPGVPPAFRVFDESAPFGADRYPPGVPVSRGTGQGQSKEWYMKMADREGDSTPGAGSVALCTICGEPMGPTEQMFYFHGSLGPCPKPPLPKVVKMVSADAYRDWTLFDKSLLFTLESHEANVAALTAEVQRLRGVVEKAVAIAEDYQIQAECLAGDGQHLDPTLAALRSRLAAFTPPAADTEGK